MDDFEAWYGGCYPRVVAALTVLAGTRQAARDAADEAFVRAYERWDRVKELAVPEAWVVRVGQNLLRRWWRRGQRTRSVATAVAPVDETDSLRPEVWVAVRALPPRQRQAIALRYLLDLPEFEVAAAMGVSVGTASATLSQARARLAAALSDFNEVPSS